MQKLRIIHVINVRWFNATAWYGLTLAYLQHCAGHEVLVITIQGTDTDIKAKEYGLKTSYINLNSKNPFAFFSTLLEMRSLLSFFAPNIVNCHRGESCILWGIMKYFFPFSLIRTRGDQRLPKKNLPNTILHKYIIDAIISTNSRMTHALEKTFSLPKNYVHTILGGVDRTKFCFSQEGRARIRKQYNFTEKDCVFGILGRFDWVKGQKEVITACGILHKTYPHLPIKLLLIGFSAGIKQEQIEQWIQEAGISSIAHITGKCADVPAHISALDVGLLSSIGSETIARAGLEILSCGKPLLSTNVGVMPDILPEKVLIHLPITLKEDEIIQCFVEALYNTTQSLTQRKLLQDAGECSISTLSNEAFFTATNTIYTSLQSSKKKD